MASAGITLCSQRQTLGARPAFSPLPGGSCSYVVQLRTSKPADRLYAPFRQPLTMRQAASTPEEIH